MPLATDILQQLCSLAIQAAQEAGQFIMAYNRTQLQVSEKSSGVSLASKVVTEVDAGSQEIILKRVLPTLKEFNLGLLTEEKTDDTSRLSKEYFWCIDPLDGTLPFIEQTDGFSVSIALVSKDGQPILGVVYDPTTKNLYHAIQGQGAYKNEKRFHVQHGAIFHLIADKYISGQEGFVSIKKQIDTLANQLGCSEVKHINYGGAVMNAIWVIEHAPACFFKLPKTHQGGGSPWDYAATACICNELQMHVTDSHGEQLQLNNATTLFMNHCGVLYVSDKTIAASILKLINTH